jgi:enoyl-CoA hydratase/carnithine racemase
MKAAATRFSTAGGDSDAVKFVDHSKSVFEFKLNQPKALNSVNTAMCQMMADKVREWYKDPASAPRTVLISGEGGKAFCAGGDVVVLYKAHVGEVADKSIMGRFFATEYLLDYSLARMKPFQISVWNGIVMGGGVGLSWHSPVRIATDNSMYAMPETAIGFFTDVGGSYFLSGIKGDPSLGLYLGITGQRVKAKDLVKWGIATHYVAQDKIPELYKSITDNVTQSTSNEQIFDIVESIADKSAAEGEIPNYDEIKHIFQLDSAQAIIARLEASDTEFAQKTKKMLTNMSPLAICIVFE